MTWLRRGYKYLARLHNDRTFELIEKISEKLSPLLKWTRLFFDVLRRFGFFRLKSHHESQVEPLEPIDCGEINPLICLWISFEQAATKKVCFSPALSPSLPLSLPLYLSISLYLFPISISLSFSQAVMVFSCSLVLPSLSMSMRTKHLFSLSFSLWKLFISLSLSSRLF